MDIDSMGRYYPRESHEDSREESERVYESGFGGPREQDHVRGAMV